MKNKILLILLIFLFSGCSAEYNLNIENDNMEESINIIVPNSNNVLIEQLIANNQTIDNNIIYEKTMEKKDINTVFNYKHNFSYDDYKTKSNPCFGISKFEFFDNYYTIYDNKFSCFESFDMRADSYKINIKTSYNVVNNNADIVNGSTYTWNFNKKNYKNKSIIFQYSKTPLENKKSNYFPLIISLIISVGLIIIIKVLSIFIGRQKVEV